MIIFVDVMILILKTLRKNRRLQAMTRNKNTLTFKVNNNGLLNIVQNELDGTVHVNRYDKEDGYINKCHIPAGDMVMLINYCMYVKDNDIQNNFINPTGKNK